MVDEKYYQIDPIQEYLSTLKKEKGISYSSFLAFERDLIRLQIWANIAGKQVHELAAEDLRDWIEHLRRSRQSPVIIERTIRLIRSLFNFFLVKGYVTTDPTIDIDTIKSNKQLPKLLSEDEVERLVAALDETSNKVSPKPTTLKNPAQPVKTETQVKTVEPTVAPSKPSAPIPRPQAKITNPSLDKEDLPDPEIPIQKPQRRRHPRIPLVIRIGLEGLSITGHHFKVEAETVLVSRCGATILADVKVEPGSTIYLTLPDIERIRAQVTGIRFDKKDKRQLIGVKLINPRTWLGN
jgi:hypothetical protein